MAMTNEQVANELKKFGDYQSVLATTLHWLKLQGSLKPLRMGELNDLIENIENILPSDVTKSVIKNVKKESKA